MVAGKTGPGARGRFRHSISQSPARESSTRRQSTPAGTQMAVNQPSADPWERTMARPHQAQRWVGDIALHTRESSRRLVTGDPGAKRRGDSHPVFSARHPGRRWAAYLVANSSPGTTISKWRADHRRTGQIPGPWNLCCSPYTSQLHDAHCPARQWVVHHGNHWTHGRATPYFVHENHVPIPMCFSPSFRESGVISCGP